MKKNKTTSRTKLFLENMLVYGLGSAIGKLIPFVLLPVITRMMPSSYYYGISDLVEVIVSFGASFSVMGMYDIMFRFFFDQEDAAHKQLICSSTLRFVALNASVLFVVLVILKTPIAIWVLGDRKYEKLVIIAATSIFFSAISLIVSAPTRMQNQRKKYLIINAIIPIFSYGCAMVLLKLGAYEYALPMVTMCNYLFLTIVFGMLNRDFFRLKKCNWDLIKKMLMLGIPLVPNFVIYWIFNSSDRLMINYFLGTEAAGVYGVGAKLGHLSQLIYTAFAGGWQYFAFSTMTDTDQVDLTSKVFEYLGALTFTSGIFVTICSKFIFYMLFPQSYGEGYIVMPYMFISPLLLMLYQTAGNQFLIIKKTWPTMFILLVGAIANLLINFFLIPISGIEGAAIGTLSGYAISVTICIIVLKKMHLFNIKRRFVKCIFAYIIFLLVWRISVNQGNLIPLLSGGITISYIVYLYKDDLKVIVKKIGKDGK